MKALALVCALSVGCASAQKHPAITAAIVGGVVGGLACEFNDPSKQSTCGLITVSAAAFLGGITALITLFTDTSAHELAPDQEQEEDESDAIHTSTPPPPGMIDGGVAVDSGVAVDATVDAGVMVDDRPIDSLDAM